MYGDDNNGCLVGSNDGRQSDTWTVRNRLYSGYLTRTMDCHGAPSSEVWGCPSVAPNWWEHGPSWWWNAGWGETCDEDGAGVSTPAIRTDCCWGDSSNYPLFVDGRGYSPKKSPDVIAVITDSGGGWYGNNLPNHDLGTGLFTGSNTLFLSGRAVFRKPSQANTTWNGGAWVRR